MQELEANLFAYRPPEKELSSTTSVLVGQAAQVVDNAYQAQRRAATVTPFLDALVETVTKKDLPSLLIEPRGVVNGRRQPSFVEAVVETAKRLELIEDLLRHVPDSVIGVVIGGSLSYGRFYNVRGAPDPSDIDLFYIVSPFFFEHDSVEAFGPIEQFRDEDIENINNRALRFISFFDNSTAEMLSHKFQTDEFVVSIKILPFRVFENEFVMTPRRVIEEASNTVEPILDYKAGSYPTQTFFQYNFLAEPFLFHISEDVLADGSAITAIPSVIFLNGHFYTGDHHNHTIPNADVVFDRDGSVAKVLATFHQLLRERVHQERAVVGVEAQLEVMNCHDRKAFFSPQVLEAARRRFA